jgi:hypothetical protein
MLAGRSKNVLIRERKKKLTAQAGETNEEESGWADLYPCFGSKKFPKAFQVFEPSIRSM